MQHQDTKIGKLRHWQFLKSVFWLGCTAFGGPQMHLPLFKRRLVDEKRFIDKDTLLDINAFCNILPGPSTTQTITALGFKLGGPRLAFLSLLAWVLPGATIMCALTLSPNFLAQGHLRFLEPMVAAFLMFAVISMLRMIRPDKINYLIFLISGLAGYLIQNPIIFPFGVLLGAVLSSNLGNRPYTPNTEPFGKIRWANFSLYIVIFLLIGSTGLLLAANENTLGISKPIILFENTYRMGSLSFGGGNMLSAMSMEHYVQYKKHLSMHDFNTGLGIIQGLPGPNFNFAIYLNGIALRNANFDFNGQMLGCLIGLVGIFLPGTLLVFFVFPIWKRLQTYPIVQRSLDGIFSASAGFILSAALILNHHFWKNLDSVVHSYTSVSVFVVSLALLISKKVPPPLIVLGTVIAGYIYTRGGI